MSAAHIHCVHIQFSNQFFLSFVWKGLEFTLPAALDYDKKTVMPNGLHTIRYRITHNQQKTGRFYLLSGLKRMATRFIDKPGAGTYTPAHIG